jgi:BlaI family transcriptional regulator, penicillinase repressor
MARPRLNRPTDAELQILAIMWRRGGCTVREVYNELKLIRGSGYNSVLKLMQIMHDKELIRRDDSVRPQVYTAIKGESPTKRHLIKDLIGRVFGGSSSALVLEALNAQKVSKGELEQIRKALSSRPE